MCFAAFRQMKLETLWPLVFDCTRGHMIFTLEGGVKKTAGGG